MRVPATESKFQALLAEAIVELDGLAWCAEQELADENADLAPTFQFMSRSLRELGYPINGGAGIAGGVGDFAYRKLVRTYRHGVPFYPPSDCLKRAHRQARGPG